MLSRVMDNPMVGYESLPELLIRRERENREEGERLRQMVDVQVTPDGVRMSDANMMKNPFGT